VHVSHAGEPPGLAAVAPRHWSPPLLDLPAQVIDTALRLARFFGGDAHSWIKLQVTYDLKLAEKAVASKIANEVHPLANAESLAQPVG